MLEEANKKSLKSYVHVQAKKAQQKQSMKIDLAQARARARPGSAPLTRLVAGGVCVCMCVCVCVISDDGWCGCLVLLSYAPEEVTAEEGSYCWSNLSVPGGHHTIAVFHSAISRHSN